MTRTSIDDFRTMNVDDAIKRFDSDIAHGLDQKAVETRLERHGYNEVSEKKPDPLMRFLKKFWGLTAWMLELIVVLSWILHKESDAYIVIGLLVFNAIIGFVQEQNAANAVEALKKKLQVTARVLRSGTWKTVLARELVPGDIIRIRIGDFVPADIKVIQGQLLADQSALTGESLEVEKNAKDVIYSGSIVSRGEATALVVLTGTDTYFGRTIQLVQIAQPKLHVETIISSVVQWLLAIVAVFLAIALLVSFFKGIDLLQIIPLMLVLLLGAVPVALPAMFTVSLALGSMELVKKGVLVTRLSAPDDAARMDILCVDKTGTITMNKLSVAKLIPYDGHSEDEILLYGALASQESNHDSIDIAFIRAAKERSLLQEAFVQKLFIPFDPKTRRTEAIILHKHKEFRVMKGSFGVLADLCGLDERSRSELEPKIAGFAQEGYRTLAVAKAAGTGTPQLVGLAGLHDPPRADTKTLIAELKNLGVSVKMLTGDALPIAREIAKSVGIGEHISSASDLKTAAKFNPLKSIELAEKSDGFAEVYPEDKYLIVKDFQAKGHIVGMTGDGVNDAPALKQAEVGTAVSNATDVAKAAASIVLVDEGLTDILGPIRIGRMMFQRINTWILNKITRTVLKTCFVVFAFLLLGKFVISASAMLIMIFMTDFVKVSLSTDNVRWSRKPAVWNIKGLVKVSVVLGILMVLEAFGLLYVGLNYFNIGIDSGALSTFSFEILFFFAMFSILVVREKGHFWHSAPSAILLCVIIADILLGVLLATAGLLGFTPIPLPQTFTVLVLIALFSFTINDLVKVLLLRKWHMDSE